MKLRWEIWVAGGQYQRFATGILTLSLSSKIVIFYSNNTSSRPTGCCCGGGGGLFPQRNPRGFLKLRKMLLGPMQFYHNIIDADYKKMGIISENAKKVNFQ